MTKPRLAIALLLEEFDERTDSEVGFSRVFPSDACCYRFAVRFGGAKPRLL